MIALGIAVIRWVPGKFDVRGRPRTAAAVLGVMLLAVASWILSPPWFRIVSAFVDTEWDLFDHPCPVTVPLQGGITAQGTGTVIYRFEFSDGSPRGLLLARTGSRPSGGKAASPPRPTSSYRRTGRSFAAEPSIMPTIPLRTSSTSPMHDGDHRESSYVRLPFHAVLPLTFETAAGQTCRPPINGNCQFGQNGAQWNTAAALFAFLVKGPDNCTPATPPTTGHCLGTKDQNANKHTSRPQGTVDFYVVGTALHVTGGGQHAVVAACQTGRSCSQGQYGVRPRSNPRCRGRSP